MGYWLIILRSITFWSPLLIIIHMEHLSSQFIMLSWTTKILILQRLTLDLCTCAVVILHYPSGHPTSLVEHLQKVEVAARITSYLPPALISGSVQLMLYLLLVIIHVSVGNIVWLDLSVDNRYPNVVNLYLRISSVIFQYQIIWRYNK